MNGLIDINKIVSILDDHTCQVLTECLGSRQPRNDKALKCKQSMCYGVLELQFGSIDGGRNPKSIPLRKNGEGFILKIQK